MCQRQGVSLRTCQYCGKAVCKTCSNIEQGVFIRKIVGTKPKYACNKCCGGLYKKIEEKIIEAFKLAGKEKLQNIMNRIFIVEAMSNEEGS